MPLLGVLQTEKQGAFIDLDGDCLRCAFRLLPGEETLTGRALLVAKCPRPPLL